MKTNPLPVRFLFVVLAVMTAALTGCRYYSNHQKHGDFTSSNSIFSPKHIRWLSSPGFTTQMKEPVEFAAVNLPVKVNPLNFETMSSWTPPEGVSEEEFSKTKRRGLLLIEVLSYPDRKLLRKFTYNPMGFSLAKQAGKQWNRELLTSFIFRVSVKEDFYPHWDMRFIELMDVSGAPAQ